MDMHAVDVKGNEARSVKGHIVVVEDNREIARLLVAVLTGEGYSVTWLEDPWGVLQSISDQRPDLIILDLTLAGVDGQDLLKALRAAPGPQAAVLICSASDLDPALLSLLPPGDILQKPFDLDVLCEKVACLTEGAQTA